jgi:ribosomal protein S25
MAEKKALSDRERKRVKTTLSLNGKLIELLDKYLARIPPTRKDFGQSHVITDIMSRYDALMRIERRALRDLFTQNELNLMLNNALSTIYGTGEDVLGSVLADTEDEENSQFEYFEVDRSVLINKLRNLTPGQQFALIDWLEEMRSNIN